MIPFDDHATGSPATYIAPCPTCGAEVETVSTTDHSAILQPCGHRMGRVTFHPDERRYEFEE